MPFPEDLKVINKRVNSNDKKKFLEALKLINVNITNKPKYNDLAHKLIAKDYILDCIKELMQCAHNFNFIFFFLAVNKFQIFEAICHLLTC